MLTSVFEDNMGETVDVLVVGNTISRYLSLRDENTFKPVITEVANVVVVCQH